MAVHSVKAYTAYNRGTSTGTGSEQTIVHGLGATPNRVKVWPTADPAGTVIAFGTHTATNILFTVTTGKAYMWEAEVF
jgi:hypothetical protein